MLGSAMDRAAAAGSVFPPTVTAGADPPTGLEVTGSSAPKFGSDIMATADLESSFRSPGRPLPGAPKAGADPGRGLLLAVGGRRPPSGAPGLRLGASPRSPMLARFWSC